MTFDDDDNNSVKKQLVLWPKQQLCTCITLFSTFLWCPRHDYDVKPPNATLCGGPGHTTTNFPFSISTWIKPLIKNSTPGKVAYIWRIERYQIDAIKFERTQIHFFGDVFTAATLGARDCQVFIVTRAKSSRLRPLANTENSHRTREKPLVPKVHCRRRRSCFKTSKNCVPLLAGRDT